MYLDTRNKLTDKEIAERVGVRPNTVGNWIKKYGWEKLRKSLLTTRQEQLIGFYDQLEALNNHIKTRPIQYDVPDHLINGRKVKNDDGESELVFDEYNEEDYPILVGNFPTSKEANTQMTITNNIKKLETELSIREIYEVGTGLLDYIKPQDFELYKTLIPFFDGFLNTKLV
ncbi:terminase gpP N-terminus-related DNA-binding protein [Leeuwenhoekiella parthenopeia]|uniref:terminase gpP N-terminus-related DNA-binding protein n=1 Tax=Leeuwenhoekiella parthenopeia TaxID=2890320 RepID=UPI0021D427EF|nr:hypothetical protein [Leeuwenhoekiella parthenopeia]